MPKDILTYSALRAFQTCPRKYHLRYDRCLVPLREDDVLYLGQVWHGVMELWYGKGALEIKLRAARDLIDRSFPDHLADRRQKRDWHLCHAMFEGYVGRYPREDFELIDTEIEFRIPIVNPITGRASRTFELRGKVDGLVRMLGSSELFLLEHKTASQISGDYIERLPTDFQINLYQFAFSRFAGKPIDGVLYSVIQKASLRQGEGETEEQFQQRRAELIARSKTGRSSAKRRLPESDEDFRSRLTGKYRDPAMFHREMLYISRDDSLRAQQEVWELGQQLLTARRRGFWTPNRHACFQLGNRPCAYWALCRSGDSPVVRENHYTIRPPHEELSNETDQPF